VDLPVGGLWLRYYFAGLLFKKNVASVTSTRLVTREPAWLTSELGIPVSLGTLQGEKCSRYGRLSIGLQWGGDEVGAEVGDGVES
jgi:hypothetical protein